MKNKYYIYVALVDDKPMYVGKGCLSRWKHLLGVGACSCKPAYGLFKRTPDTIHIYIETKRYDTSAEAVAREIELIEELRPEWNIEYNPDKVAEQERAKRLRVEAKRKTVNNPNYIIPERLTTIKLQRQNRNIEIRRLKAEGYTHKVIAKKFGVATKTIQRILKSS